MNEAERDCGALIATLRQYPSALVALSGGVDSAVLLAAAHAALGPRCEAATFVSALHSAQDRRDAQELAKQLGVRHHILQLDEYAVPELVENSRERCYYCKRYAFGEMQAVQERRGLAALLDGTNADDLQEYRPGLRALAELGVCSPLAQLGLSKQRVRRMARHLGVEVAQKPSSPCLATRVPYGTALTPELLRGIERMEQYLRARGFAVCRCRVHGDLVRVELPPEQWPAFLADDEFPRRAKEEGYVYITLDVEGFRSGSMDETAR